MYAVTEADERTVLGFGVSRVGKFFLPITLTPNLLPPVIVRLGRTRFADLEAGPSTSLSAMLGANIWHYREFHYFGSPGGYLNYAFEAGRSGPSQQLIDFIRNQLDGGAENVFPLDPASSPAAEEAWLDARRSEVIDGYWIYHWDLDPTQWANLPR